MKWTALELCAGGGGQALGLEMAGFDHAGLVEIDRHCCETLRLNRPCWSVFETDFRHLNPAEFKGIDLLAAGVPCPPFSIAGKQLGGEDDRDMFPSALEFIEKAGPRGVLLENVPGFASKKFEAYRADLLNRLNQLGYHAQWRVLESADFGVPQLRPRFLLVALKPKDAEFFQWPEPVNHFVTVGDALLDLMAEKNWRGAEAWSRRAAGIAPTLVGGSKKHGGPDLGPTRARAQWAKLWVDGIGLADSAPDAASPLDLKPRLTVRMAARVQSFPDDWLFFGKKTPAYRQVGNAFPPLVAEAVGRQIIMAFERRRPNKGRHKAEQLALLEKCRVKSNGKEKRI